MTNDERGKQKMKAEKTKGLTFNFSTTILPCLKIKMGCSFASTLHQQTMGKKKGWNAMGGYISYCEPEAQTHFRVEPRVALKIPKMTLKVAMKLLSIFGIEAQGCLVV